MYSGNTIQDSIQPIFDGKPGTLVQLGYENEKGTKFTVIRVFFPMQMR